MNNYNYITKAETFITTQDAQLLAELKIIFGHDKLTQLRQFLANVIEDTGYGDVKIVIADGKVQLLKVEKSYK